MSSIELIKIKVHGITNSFRIPFHMTVHDTLTIPPKTTIIGMLGAALGYSRIDANLVALYNNTYVGILGSSKAKYYDLMRIYKLAPKAKPGQLQRQINYDNLYTIYIENSRNLDAIYMALKNPVYALSLGKAHEIINMSEISKTERDTIESDYINVSNTIVPFEIKDFDIDEISEGTITPLVSIQMPLSFSIKDGYRDPENFCRITEITNLKLKIKRMGYKAIHDNDYDTDVILQ
jgi:CRISPR-associated protein Cas5t